MIPEEFENVVPVVHLAIFAPDVVVRSGRRHSSCSPCPRPSGTPPSPAARPCVRPDQDRRSPWLRAPQAPAPRVAEWAPACGRIFHLSRAEAGSQPVRARQGRGHADRAAARRPRTTQRPTAATVCCAPGEPRAPAPLPRTPSSLSPPAPDAAKPPSFLPAAAVRGASTNV